MLFGREAFETLGETVVVPDREISAADVADADALIVRSKTAINEALLRDSRLAFVGTATAGTDHMDIGYLNHVPLAWCSAPGCNANSVAEYVVSGILSLANRHGFEPRRMCIGVVGVGEVGSRVVRKAEALGITVLRNDPPLRLATGDPEFLPIEEVLAHADILTFHVPLTASGPFPTHHLANADLLSRLKPGCILINASRGEVVETEALLCALDHGVVSHAILDVWEGEPRISREALEQVELGTPHIAGYSFEGRVNGTVAVYREACHFFEVEPAWTPNEKAFPRAPRVHLDARGLSDEALLWSVVSAVYNIEGDDRALREGLSGDESLPIHFERLRRSYPPRREFPSVTAGIEHAHPKVLERIGALGFRIAPF